MFCSHCGNEIGPGDRFCSRCGIRFHHVDGSIRAGIPRDIPDRKLMAGLLGILLGGLGIHKFYLGFVKEGIIEFVLSVISCGLLGVLGFIEGLIYLTKSEENFYQDYIIDRKKWF